MKNTININFDLIEEGICDPEGVSTSKSLDELEKLKPEFQRLKRLDDNIKAAKEAVEKRIKRLDPPDVFEIKIHEEILRLLRRLEE